MVVDVTKVELVVEAETEDGDKDGDEEEAAWYTIKVSVNPSPQGISLFTVYS